MLYLLVALGIGLFISSSLKNQFVASQVTMLVTFLPAMMLSGFLFDLRSMPAVVRLLTYVLPARYYVALLQTLFLAGDIWARDRAESRWCWRRWRPCWPCADRGGSCARAWREDDMIVSSLLRILALTRKELLAVLKDPRSRVDTVHSADPAVPDLRLCGDLRSDRRPLRGARSGSQRRSHDLLAAARRLGRVSTASPISIGADDIKTCINERQALLVDPDRPGLRAAT